MPDAGKIVTLLLAGLALHACGACDSADGPTSRPVTKSAEEQLTLIEPESLSWTQAEAAEKLDDAELGVSAAVRLVRLSDTSPLCVPQELSDESVRRLRLRRLVERRWVLGLRDPTGDDALRAPVLISADGEVLPIADGVEEELLVLHISRDADVFPHAAILPDRVMIVGEQTRLALLLEPEQRVRFELREHEGFSYVGLISRESPDSEEVAYYRWDPFEAVFVGPASDKLPEPRGGKFKLDLDASKLLVPMGGEIPEPEPIEQKAPNVPRQRVPREWQPA
jgi:hypothetical protein